MPKSIGNTIYEDTAQFGRIRATIGLIFGCIISIIVIIIGIIQLRSKNPHTTEVTATVTSLVYPCVKIDYLKNENKEISRTDISCSLRLKYDYDGKTFEPSTPLITDDKYYSTNPNEPNNKIKLWIDPTNPVDYSRQSKQADIFIGWILIGAAIFILLISILSWWITQKSTLYAAAQGGVGVVNLFRGQSPI